MDRFTVWSPFDGQPIPAQNEQVRDSLLAEGYLAEEPTEEQAIQSAIDRSMRQLAADAGVPEHLLATGGLVDNVPLNLVGESGPELWDPSKTVAENAAAPAPARPLEGQTAKRPRRKPAS